jgi:hypothetical protein
MLPVDMVLSRRMAADALWARWRTESDKWLERLLWLLLRPEPNVSGSSVIPLEPNVPCRLGEAKESDILGFLELVPMSVMVWSCDNG